MESTPTVSEHPQQSCANYGSTKPLAPFNKKIAALKAGSFRTVDGERECLAYHMAEHAAIDRSDVLELVMRAYLANDIEEVQKLTLALAELAFEAVIAKVDFEELGQ